MRAALSFGHCQFLPSLSNARLVKFSRRLNIFNVLTHHQAVAGSFFESLSYQARVDYGNSQKAGASRGWTQAV